MFGQSFLKPKHNNNSTPQSDDRRSRRSKYFKWLIGIIGLIILLTIGYYGYLAALTLKRIQFPDGGGRSGSFFPFIGAKMLEGEKDHRVNILLIGIGGGKHPGGLLADTIILASINPRDKKAAFMSIPRDLYVPLPKPLAGADKINAAHALAEKDLTKTGGGPAYLKKVVVEVFDQPVHYLIRVDFEGFKQIVEAVGGVTINVDKAIHDPFYPAPNMIDYEPFSIKAGIQTLKGEIALKYVRSRETTSDFDRARRQQQLILAIRDKVLSLNIIANPKKIAEIANIIGSHIKTDLELGEMERLANLVKDIPRENIINKVLDNGPEGPLVSVNNGGYYLKPKDGTYDELKLIAQNILSLPSENHEGAKIEIINATSENGVGSKLASELELAGFTITRISKQDTTQVGNIIYDAASGQKPKALKAIADKINVTSVTTTRPTNLLGNSTADFVIIIGNEQ